MYCSISQCEPHPPWLVRGLLSVPHSLLLPVRRLLRGGFHWQSPTPTVSPSASGRLHSGHTATAGCKTLMSFTRSSLVSHFMLLLFHLLCIILLSSVAFHYNSFFPFLAAPLGPFSIFPRLFSSLNPVHFHQCEENINSYWDLTTGNWENGGCAECKVCVHINLTYICLQLSYLHNTNMDW